MDVSVVIPAYNAEHTIGDQLEALAKQDFDGNWEIVVVDNASTDATRRIAEEWRMRLANFRIIDEPERGVNRARNTGVRAAVADRVLLCDSDDVVDVAWVRCLAGALDEHAVVAGRLEYATLNSEEVEARSSYQPLSNGLAVSWRRSWGMTCNLGFHREVFDTIDGFDPSFERGGSDDVDFCFRAGAAGFALGFAHEAVVHYRRRSESKQLARQMYHYAKGSEHLYEKHRRLGEFDEFPRRTRWNVSAARAGRLVRALPMARTDTGRHIVAARAAQLAGGVAGMWEWQMKDPQVAIRTRSIVSRATTWLAPNGIMARRRTHARATMELERRARYDETMAARSGSTEPIDDYDVLLGLATEAGVDADLLRIGSIPVESLDFILERIEDRPGLHLGNYAGLSLAYLAARTEGVIVAVDPNIEHWGLRNPQDTVVRLIEAAGVSDRVLLVCGYSLGKNPGNDGSLIAGYDPAVGFAAEVAPVNVLSTLQSLGMRFGWAVLDGNHEPEYLRAELDALIPLMTDDGLVFLDDIDPHWPDIRAVFDDPRHGWLAVGSNHRIGVLRRTTGS